MKHDLLIFGCSSRKRESEARLPAVVRYDGPHYRSFRRFLRQHEWPKNLSLGILSAEFGLIGGFAPIQNYDHRMSIKSAESQLNKNKKVIQSWITSKTELTLFLGKDYLPALPIDNLRDQVKSLNILGGGIGTKLGKLSNFLENLKAPDRNLRELPKRRPLYILPDWDDLLDPSYDFTHDLFSAPKSERQETHCARFMKPNRICDGILVSLAQSVKGKGPLRSIDPADHRSLRPVPLKKHYGLTNTQFLFGDCGAFSYVNEQKPAITVDQAISLYDLHGFDFGTSVDHIPVREIKIRGQKIKLSMRDRKQRVVVTKDLADEFIQTHRSMKSSFTPIGVIQGLDSHDYARQVGEYADMGYKFIAIGGLVPRTDDENAEIAKVVMEEVKNYRSIQHVHLFGIFRPKLQSLFQEIGITSFDSATYFRKAWLRSGQNYLGTDGKWYAAIRVPMTRDPRTLNRLMLSGLNVEELQKLESNALASLFKYDSGKLSLRKTLLALEEYDQHLGRASVNNDIIQKAYRITLETRPWESCNCCACTTAGINTLIFRGSNRNKRRGAHNTLQLYRYIRSRSV